jgi:hypothetical protein
MTANASARFVMKRRNALNSTLEKPALWIVDARNAKMLSKALARKKSGVNGRALYKHVAANGIGDVERI